MERWVLYAFISMFFAGFTAVIARDCKKISVRTPQILDTAASETQ